MTRYFNSGLYEDAFYTKHQIDYNLSQFIFLGLNNLTEYEESILLNNNCEYYKLENLNINDDILYSIQKHFGSDIRSMINYMQSNQDIIQECKIIKNDLWIDLTNDFKKGENQNIIINKINDISYIYNIERKNIIKNYLNYIIRNHTNLVNEKFLNIIENIMHLAECKTDYILNYIVIKLTILFKSFNK